MMNLNQLLVDIAPPGMFDALFQADNRWTLVVAGLVVTVAAVVAARTYFKKSGKDFRGE